jgi:serpin B
MLVLLPKEGSSVADLEKSLSQESFDKWMGGLKSQEVQVFLPRFTITWGANSITEQLKALGLKTVFTDKADLSGITGDKTLDVSDVVHKAFVEVNEEGTEAAAATGVIARATAARMEEPPVFRADRPFVFLILDKASENIVFMGKVADPTK